MLTYIWNSQSDASLVDVIIVVIDYFNVTVTRRLAIARVVARVVMVAISAVVHGYCFGCFKCALCLTLFNGKKEASGFQLSTEKGRRS
jgi:hypothetical protein